MGTRYAKKIKASDLLQRIAIDDPATTGVAVTCVNHSHRHRSFVPRAAVATPPLLPLD